MLLFGIGTRALPSWDSRTRRTNLSVGLAVDWRQVQADIRSHLIRVSALILLEILRLGVPSPCSGPFLPLDACVKRERATGANRQRAWGAYAFSLALFCLRLPLLTPRLLRLLRLTDFNRADVSIDLDIEIGKSLHEALGKIVHVFLMPPGGSVRQCSLLLQ